MARLEITLGLIFIMATVLVVGYMGLTEPARMDLTFEAQQARAIEVGAALYDSHCRGCHGIKGEGILGVGPPLSTRHFFENRLAEVGFEGALEDYVRLTIAAGRPVGSPEYAVKMPTWGQQFGGPLRPDQVDALAAFIMNWAKTAPDVVVEIRPTPTPLPVEATPEERGLAAFMAVACNACHAIQDVEGAVGQVGPDLTHIATVAAGRIPGVSARDYIVESIVDPDAFIVPDCPIGPCQRGLMPPDFGQRLSEQELDDLVAFLLSLQ